MTSTLASEGGRGELSVGAEVCEIRPGTGRLTSLVSGLRGGLGRTGRAAQSGHRRHVARERGKRGRDAAPGSGNSSAVSGS